MMSSSELKDSAGPIHLHIIRTNAFEFNSGTCFANGSTFPVHSEVTVGEKRIREDRVTEIQLYSMPTIYLVRVSITSRLDIRIQERFGRDRLL